VAIFCALIGTSGLLLRSLANQLIVALGRDDGGVVDVPLADCLLERCGRLELDTGFMA